MTRHGSAPDLDPHWQDGSVPNPPRRLRVAYVYRNFNDHGSIHVTGAPWMDVPGDVVATSISASKIHTPTYYTGFFTTHRFYRVVLVQ